MLHTRPVLFLIFVWIHIMSFSKTPVGPNQILSQRETIYCLTRLDPPQFIPPANPVALPVMQRALCFHCRQTALDKCTKIVSTYRFCPTVENDVKSFQLRAADDLSIRTDHRLFSSRSKLITGIQSRLIDL